MICNDFMDPKSIRNIISRNGIATASKRVSINRCRESPNLYKTDFELARWAGKYKDQFQKRRSWSTAGSAGWEIGSVTMVGRECLRTDISEC